MNGIKILKYLNDKTFQIAAPIVREQRAFAPSFYHHSIEMYFFIIQMSPDNRLCPPVVERLLSPCALYTSMHGTSCTCMGIFHISMG